MIITTKPHASESLLQYFKQEEILHIILVTTCFTCKAAVTMPETRNTTAFKNILKITYI